MHIQQAFKILGVDKGSSRKDVKHAYRQLVKACHPDRYHNDPDEKKRAEEKLKQINRAYRAVCQLQPREHITRVQKTPPSPAPPVRPRRKPLRPPSIPGRKQAARPKRDMPFQEFLSQAVTTDPHRQEEGQDSFSPNKPRKKNSPSPWLGVHRRKTAQNTEAISPIQPVQRVRKIKKI
jgi:hypothetical protein